MRKLGIFILSAAIALLSSCDNTSPHEDSDKMASEHKRLATILCQKYAHTEETKFGVKFGNQPSCRNFLFNRREQQLKKDAFIEAQINKCQEELKLLKAFDVTQFIESLWKNVGDKVDDSSLPSSCHGLL